MRNVMSKFRDIIYTSYGPEDPELVALWYQTFGHFKKALPTPEETHATPKKKTARNETTG